MRYLILAMMFAFSSNLIAGQIYEIETPQDVEPLGGIELRRKIESLIKETHPGLEFMYCAALVQQDGKMLYAFFETQDEAHEGAITLLPNTEFRMLHVFPRRWLRPQRGDLEIAIIPLSMY